MARMRLFSWKYASCLTLVCAIAASAIAASPSAKKETEPAKAVELFAGIDAGDIEAVLIQKDATEGTLMLRNKSGQPLTIKVPSALAGVPILAQRGGGGAMG